MPYSEALPGRNEKKKGRTMRKILAALVAMSLLAGAAPVLSHHSFAMFDRSTELVLEGSVVRWAFNSPHIALYLETGDGTLYSLEGAAPVRLLSARPAMDGFSFQPGQHVRVVYCPLHDGRPGGAIGIVIDDAGAFYRPNDGVCHPNHHWDQCLAAGYTSMAAAGAEAEAEAGR